MQVFGTPEIQYNFGSGVSTADLLGTELLKRYGIPILTKQAHALSPLLDFPTISRRLQALKPSLLFSRENLFISIAIPYHFEVCP